MALFPDGYAIRQIENADASALALAYTRNRVHLAPWEPPRETSFYTEPGQAAAIVGMLAAAEVGTQAAYVVTHGDQIVGRLTLNNIVRGPLQSASVGYWIDGQHLRRGLAFAAVEFACAGAVRRGLHRLEAGTGLDNYASQQVLLSGGFEQFGHARDYLFIDGAWRDHLLYQRILYAEPRLYQQ